MNLDSIAITGMGAVSSAGWGVAPLMKAVWEKRALPSETRQRHPESRPAEVRPVPKPDGPCPVAPHPRLRRASAITRYALAAALEALGPNAAERFSKRRLGVISVFMNGCVNYSNRFYSEVLEDPALASPILFPETVFNAPASHLATVLGQTANNDTLVGDSGQFLSGVELGIRWLQCDQVDACLIVGSEELDWLSTEAAQLFGAPVIVSEGAGALLLEADARHGVVIDRITDPDPLTPRGFENHRVLSEGGREADACLVDSRHARFSMDRHEDALWEHWRGQRLSPLQLLGYSMGAGLALQCVIAAAAIREGRAAAGIVSHLSTSRRMTGARFLPGNA